MKKELVNKELEDLATVLRDLKKQDDGFRLPDQYFEDLEESVFNKIDAMESRRRPILSARKGKGLRQWLLRPQLMAAAAAVFVVVLAAKWFFTPKPVPASAPAPVAAAQLTEEEMIEAYVLENIRDFDVNQLAAFSPDPDMETGSTPRQNKKLQPHHPLDGLSPDEVDMLLKEMSDEELEKLL